MGWDGMGWDGMGWDGMGWSVLSSMSDLTVLSILAYVIPC